MFVVGVVQDARSLASIMRCRLDLFPSTYLGLPLGAKGIHSAMWDPVFQNLERKIASWKAKFFSFGARVTLLKSVLFSLPVYYLSLFKAPAKVISRLEQLQNQFLWAGNLVSEKIHWIEWNTVKTPKCREGLGVQDLHVLNTTLMSKWSLRFGIERNAWWRKLIVTKCGLGHSEWSPRWNLGLAGCSVWRWHYKKSVTWRRSFGELSVGF
ncbi:Putative ribonuclease H protein At1g65750 [Linum grandiflorum]